MGGVNSSSNAVTYFHCVCICVWDTRRLKKLNTTREVRHNVTLPFFLMLPLFLVSEFFFFRMKSGQEYGEYKSD